MAGLNGKLRPPRDRPVSIKPCSGSKSRLSQAPVLLRCQPQVAPASPGLYRVLHHLPTVRIVPGAQPAALPGPSAVHLVCDSEHISAKRESGHAKALCFSSAGNDHVVCHGGLLARWAGACIQAARVSRLAHVRCFELRRSRSGLVSRWATERLRWLCVGICDDRFELLLSHYGG
jgi:hypothetical protein